jgi:lanosterol synthase
MLKVKPSWKDWQLLTQNGRQIWAYKPISENIEEHLAGITGFSKSHIKHWVSDFKLDKQKNPNSADKVFRFQQVNANYQRFTGQVPVADTVENQQVVDALVKGVNYYSHLQTTEGYWPGDYAGPMFLLPGLIIAAYISATPFPEPHREMMKIYLANHQNEDGGWGMHIEGNSTMFGTVMQYVAMRILGVEKGNQQLSRARKWIHENGGAVGIPSWGKFYLAILNLYDWQGFNSLFPEMWLFPKWLPMHPWRYWCHCRLVYLPMSYCYGQRIQMHENDLILSLREEIFTENYADIKWPKQRDEVCDKDIYTVPSPVLKWLNFFTNGYEKFNLAWLRKKALAYIIGYLNAEDQQTNFLDIGPVSQAINSICIWHAYGKDSSQFKQHVERWYDYLWVAEDGMKMNGYNGSQLWDVALSSKAIMESDIGKLFNSTIKKSYSFIEQSQIKSEHPTHQKYFRHPMIGSWPFSTAEQGWPVADCTAKGLSATLSIHKSGLVTPVIDKQRIKAAVEVILSYQNKDGGWGTYELQRAPEWLEKLNPSEIFADIMVDYSWTECTSACVISLIEVQEMMPDLKHKDIHNAIVRGLRFIIAQQKPDGSWYGGWAVCFTYASWFAVEALSNAKGRNYIADESLASSIVCACAFLVSKQKADGGWGETFESCSKRVYSEAATSQVVNTAWVLMALMAADYQDNAVLDQGIQLLLSRQTELGDWEQENISGVFNYNCMITYSAYRNTFPIWALNRYFKQYIC